MAFMMPVVKNDWDIYNTQRSRRTSEAADKAGGAGAGGRVRKVSESRSEGPALSPRQLQNVHAHGMSPHRSAPTMRSLSYCRAGAPPSRSSRASLRTDSPTKGSASPPAPARAARDGDKFHSRARAETPERSRCGACVPYL